MRPLQKHLDPQTLTKLNRLQLRVAKALDGYVAGRHRSPQKGFSVEFAEHREYSPGDDLRHIDWRVFGRTEKYYVKRFEDETNLVLHLLLDFSSSMQFRGAESKQSKQQFAQRLAVVLAWLAIEQRDAVSLCVFTEELDVWSGIGNSWGHLDKAVQMMDQTQSQPKTSIGKSLHSFSNRIRKKGLVIVLSDFLVEIPDAMDGLNRLVHAGHDVVAMQVLDASESTFPFRRTTLFRGVESKQQVIAEPIALRKAYLNAFQEFQHQLQMQCRKSHIEFHQWDSSQAVDQAVASFLLPRMFA